MLFSIIEGLKIAFQALVSNPLRSVLTTLGVVIGITFVILMGWLLQGLDNVLEQTISFIGEDVLYVDKWDWAGRVRWSEIRNRPNFNLEHAEKVQNLLTSAEIVSPTLTMWSTSAKVGNLSMSNARVMASYSQHIAIMGDVVEHGRFFSATEDRYTVNSAVIGYEIASSLFNDPMPIGKTIYLNNRPFNVIGVMKKRATFLLDELDREIWIPITAFRSVYGLNRSASIAIKAGSIDKLDELRYEATGVVRRVRNLKPSDKDNFSINEQKVFREQAQTFRITVWTVGIGMTALSFLVGIIGIMNIMFVSVTERTKEIGIRKALGAKKRSILFQFLVESATLCLMGATVAFVLCSAIMFGVVKNVEQASFLSPYIPLQLLFTATVVSIIVGIMAGLIPALRAASLDPVEALRKD